MLVRYEFANGVGGRLDRQRRLLVQRRRSLELRVARQPGEEVVLHIPDDASHRRERVSVSRLRRGHGRLRGCLRGLRELHGHVAGSGDRRVAGKRRSTASRHRRTAKLIGRLPGIGLACSLDGGLFQFSRGCPFRRLGLACSLGGGLFQFSRGCPFRRLYLLDGDRGRRCGLPLHIQPLRGRAASLLRFLCRVALGTRRHGAGRSNHSCTKHGQRNNALRAPPLSRRTANERHPDDHQQQRQATNEQRTTS